ncbi:UDP-N-acetylmuramoyl-L-alanine--D-glutamate ligase [Thalassomonas viridans]|uniref:UDP-N-acetylmuramoylalanine--D-glutamate ligase n=1 Tax=Thalassomonas viridans TaxID=137584 RepID=A0AAE9Z3E6_9GAMM|nr:UDP-N-acetylmuramoyl-L-alanine--D-glutamate ligase [Thalassomonas viridans]WDE06021.1 UDP-N-acetylmuramoyl-L-alanine--D-glutamate ligase [Thalassomonas viridans]
MTKVTAHIPPELLKQLTGKRILILGLGQTGLSCARFLVSCGLKFAVNDSREKAVDETTFKRDYPGCCLVQGKWDSEQIASAELILASPGIDMAQEVIAGAVSPDCMVWGDVEFFSRISEIPVIAVTGSNGKSTVVSLLAHLADSLGKNAALGGNVGVPVLDLLKQAPELLILELSSFQLETISSMKPLAASVLNLSDDHLERHLTMENYRNIKQKIYRQAGVAVINRDDNATWVNEEAFGGKVISFGSDAPQEGHFGLATINEQLTLMYGAQALVAVRELPLSGAHNALNCLAVLALGLSAGWLLEDMLSHLGSFTGLEHRCQALKTNDDILWINDSKATNVGATIAAISGLAQTKNAGQQLILIAGGDGKGADFTPLQPLLQRDVNKLITLGKDGDQLAALTANSHKVDDLKQAVELAGKAAKPGDIVLLSPACSSLDMFTNFAVRGQVFADAVQAYVAQQAPEAST